jgi:hypothetical protein
LDTGEDHDQLRLAQEEYDLYSVAVIALEEEIASLRDVAEARYNRKSGKDTQGIRRDRI